MPAAVDPVGKRESSRAVRDVFALAMPLKFVVAKVGLTLEQLGCGGLPCDEGENSTQALSLGAPEAPIWTHHRVTRANQCPMRVGAK